MDAAIAPDRIAYIIDRAKSRLDTPGRRIACGNNADKVRRSLPNISAATAANPLSIARIMHQT